MKPYKQLQAKALHKGAYIGYVIAKQHQYTTNGQVMVAKAITPEELKPLKDQYDARVDGSEMKDMSFVIDNLNSGVYAVANAEIDDWTNEAGLQLTRARAKHPDGDMEVNVQSIYIDYLNALYDDLIWYMTPRAVFCTTGNNQIVGIIAPVKEVKNG